MTLALVSVYILLSRAAYIFWLGWAYDNPRDLKKEWDRSPDVLAKGVLLELFVFYNLFIKWAFVGSISLLLKAGRGSKSKLYEFKDKSRQPRLEGGQLSSVDNGQLSHVSEDWK